MVDFYRGGFTKKNGVSPKKKKICMLAFVNILITTEKSERNRKNDQI